MMFWHDKVGQERLSRPISYQFGKFVYDAVRTKISQKIKLSLARAVSTAVGQVDDLTLGWPVDRAVWRIDETGHAFGMPMVAPGLTRRLGRVNACPSKPTRSPISVSS